MTQALEIEGVEVRYGKTYALRGVSLTVAPSEVVALVGANGAGKSSLLNTVMGLVPHAAGRMHVGGKPVDRCSTRERILAGLALSPEGRCVFPELSVHENLELGDLGQNLDRRQEQRETIYRWFPRLLERREQLAGTMSGGEQQMLAIGRAMMARPRVLLLDEPTLGLAPRIVHEISDFLRAVRAVGVSVVLAEQNAEMALAVADRAYVLQNGEVVMSGPAQTVAGDPQVRAAYLGL